MSEPLSTFGITAALFRLGDEIVTINKNNGWDVLQPHDWPIDPDEPATASAAAIFKIKTARLAAVMALIHSEVSEALEALRKSDKENFEEELADVIIRVLDCSHGLGIDLGPVIVAKLQKNKMRGYRHGGKAI
jgi:NTP pyrophosphatase (non-canonical NTP hydrolase)